MRKIQSVEQCILALSTIFLIFQDTEGNLNCLEQNVDSRYLMYSAFRSDRAKVNLRRMCRYSFSGTQTQDVVH